MSELPSKRLPKHRSIRTVDDVLTMLDRMFTSDISWDAFYADRGKPIPFFEPKLDENLASYLARGLLAPGRPGTGLRARPQRDPPRLVRFHGGRGRSVTCGRGLGRGARRRGRRPRPVPPDRHLLGRPARRPLRPGYDSGCLHHLPPHRRVSYRALLDRVLAPGGHSASRVSRPAPWLRTPRRGVLPPGSALRRPVLLAGGTALDLLGPDRGGGASHGRQPPGSPLFGVPFLLTALFRRPEAR